ncbi:MAG TPA: serine hydrolase [Gemmatimonadaceae bacterium]|nr:serine hydrolase [Gemmatimonadaceae bacterium]
MNCSLSPVRENMRIGLARLIPLLLVILLASGCGRAISAQSSAPARAVTPVRADTAMLRRSLDSIADAHHGVVGYSIIDMENGVRMSRRGSETFPTASLIKVPILVTLYALAAKGEISLYDPLTVLKIDQVPGAGVLQYFHNGTVITVRDAAWLMTTISDNTATNLLLDRIIIRRVWNKMDSLGLHNTKVHSKTFKRNSSVAMDSSVKYGLGVTTPDEMARLFELLALGKAVNKTADSAMLDILEHNTDQELLQRFAGGVRAAHKTGATDQVRTECSLFFLRNRIVACVMTKENKDIRWVIDTEPQLTIARMGEAIVKAWGGNPANAPPQ